MKRTKKLTLSRKTITITRLDDVAGGAPTFKCTYTMRAGTCDNSGCDCGPSTPMWTC
jgi:hypothetical protein